MPPNRTRNTCNRPKKPEFKFQFGARSTRAYSDCREVRNASHIARLNGTRDLRVNINNRHTFNTLHLLSIRAHSHTYPGVTAATIHRGPSTHEPWFPPVPAHTHTQPSGVRVCAFCSISGRMKQHTSSQVDRQSTYHRLHEE